MAYNATTGIFTRVSNSFSNPSTGQIISPTDGDSYFDDLDGALNSTFLARQLFLSLSANQAGTNVNTAQPWFPGGGATGITLTALTAYLFEGVLALDKTAGTTSHTIALLFGGTATLTSIGYYVSSVAIDSSTFAATAGLADFVNVATAKVQTAASTNADRVFLARVKGIVRINGAGTFIPQYILSAAPGGAYSTQADSFFSLSPIGANTVLNQGAWA